MYQNSFECRTNWIHRAISKSINKGFLSPPYLFPTLFCQNPIIVVIPKDLMHQAVERQIVVLFPMFFDENVVIIVSPTSPGVSRNWFRGQFWITPWKNTLVPSYFPWFPPRTRLPLIFRNSWCIKPVNDLRLRGRFQSPPIKNPLYHTNHSRTIWFRGQFWSTIMKEYSSRALSHVSISIVSCWYSERPGVSKAVDRKLIQRADLKYN